MTKQRSRILLITGIVCLGFAALCAAAIGVGLVQSSSAIAGETTPSPEELGGGIRFALIAMGAGLVLGAVGLVAIIAGFINR